MSLGRLTLTTAAMALMGVALSALTPDLSAMAAGVLHAQRTADSAGPDSVVLAAGGLLAWAVWAWGAAGLALTALSALPGLVGSAARLLLEVVLPGGARHGAAVLLGVGLGVAAPVLGSTVLLPAVAAAATPESASAPAAVPDWPVATGSDTGPGSAAGGVPDWPAGGATADPRVPLAGGGHVVLRGECLWQIAADHERQRSGVPPTDGNVARAVRAWWSANAAVIGSDPDLLLPGQVLDPPS